jgi:hypothetical protein
MVYIVLVQLLNLILVTPGWAKMDRIHSEGYLGEKRLDSYANRRKPLVVQDFYRGKLSFQDEQFYQNYFTPYIFNREQDFSNFLKSELMGSLACTNEQLSEHFDDIRYSYRLIALSYLMEAQWHMNMVAKHFGANKVCRFDATSFMDKCRPKSSEMKKFVARVKKYNPKYEESLPKTYIKSDWWKDFSKKNFKYYSHYRMDTSCKGRCSISELEKEMNKVCEQDESLMNLICSELDETYGLSTAPDAYYLIGTSNIINTYNQQGQALGCLRRFSEVLGHKEVRYPVMGHLFQTLRAHLQNLYQERFLQGRVFFFGSGKEFEEKGLKDLYVMEQPLKIQELDKEEPEPKPLKAPEVKPEVKVSVAKAKPAPNQKKEIVEIQAPIKSAFLQAAEVRKSQNLDQVEVDMLKLKYDYVFTLHMINTLSEKLKTFMTREALSEMLSFDQLGSKKAPVPLLFLKYMIDMQEHTGLYNVLSVLGEEFYVSNEIDGTFKPEPEKIRLLNNESTGRQWQFFIIRP